MTAVEPTVVRSTDGTIDWSAVARYCLLSRAIDELEESALFGRRLIAYQFSAKGHELGQVVVASLLDHPHDAAATYYRSRPAVLTLGLSAREALAQTLARATAPNGGRDGGVAWNMRSRGKATVLPMSGGVGSQLTPACGWAHALDYRGRILGDRRYQGAIAVAFVGDGGVATSGFWSSLGIATTCKLPLLIVVEDNGFAISTPREVQLPGGNVCDNLRGFGGLARYDVDGTDPPSLADAATAAVAHVRARRGPALLRVNVPRLCGHSAHDTQTYKPADLLAAEALRDPLVRLEAHVVPKRMSESEWQATLASAAADVQSALFEAQSDPHPRPQSVYDHLFAEPPEGSARDAPAEPASGPRINFVRAVRQTLDEELHRDDRVLVFGEDVGVKGGVHTATTGLQEKYGVGRVFDTSLSEEGIVGRAVGLAYAGLRPVAEIQFRRYADPAKEQLVNCGTVRWRTNGNFSAPIVVRVPVGYGAVCDPFHSVCEEAEWIHQVGWRVAFPSRADDAAGLLRSAIRGDDPTLFLEHRALLSAPESRTPYPGADHVVSFGRGRVVRDGHHATLITWGAMVARCGEAIDRLDLDCDLIDLRTLAPWDRDLCVRSIQRTHRCLIVHEDYFTGGFGAEIAATLAKDCFFELDAPIERVAALDVPVAFSHHLVDVTIPTVDRIEAALDHLIRQ